MKNITGINLSFIYKFNDSMELGITMPLNHEILTREVKTRKDLEAYRSQLTKIFKASKKVTNITIQFNTIDNGLDK